MRRGRHAFFWNGRDKAGRLVPEGKYRPKVELGNADRTIVLPNPIRVDVTRPVVKVVSIRPRVISPDGDGRGDVARVRYRVERAGTRDAARGRRAAGDESEASSLPASSSGSRVGVAPGSYDLSLEAQDLAGNVSSARLGRACRGALHRAESRPADSASRPRARSCRHGRKERPLAAAQGLERRRVGDRRADDPLPRACEAGPLRARRQRPARIRRARRSSSRSRERAAALRPRRPSLRDDAAARDARPALRGSRSRTSRTSSRSSPTGTAARSTSPRSSTTCAGCRPCATGASRSRRSSSGSDRG